MTLVLVCHLMYFNRQSASWCVWSVPHLCVCGWGSNSQKQTFPFTTMKNDMLSMRNKHTLHCLCSLRGFIY